VRVWRGRLEKKMNEQVEKIEKNGREGLQGVNFSS